MQGNAMGMQRGRNRGRGMGCGRGPCGGRRWEMVHYAKPVRPVAVPKTAGPPPKPTTRLVTLVDTGTCAACGVCVPVCPAGAITVEAVATVNVTRCTGCGRCVAECPQGALRLTPAEQEST